MTGVMMRSRGEVRGVLACAVSDNETGPNAINLASKS